MATKDLLTSYDNEVKLYYCKKKNEHLGFVKLIDIMPRIVPEERTGDIAVVQGARISYGSAELKSAEADSALISYLVEHYHTSPLELASVKFMCKCPLYVFNQLVRHRMAKLNVTSRRYTKIEQDSFYVPEPRLQDTLHKQGSKDGDIPEDVKDIYNNLYEKAEDIYQDYSKAVESGIAKEIARGAMPQNIMTTFVWKCDLHNLLKMIRLRIHPTAQLEIRSLAMAMKKLTEVRFPITFTAFDKFWLNSISFSMEEIELIKTKGEFKSKRKQKEFLRKRELIGL